MTKFQMLLQLLKMARSSKYVFVDMEETARWKACKDICRDRVAICTLVLYVYDRFSSD
jgi:hypothetical protein